MCTEITDELKPPRQCHWKQFGVDMISVVQQAVDRSPTSNGQASDSGDRYHALLAVSQAIVLHRDLPALFHELAVRLHEVVRFDWLALILHEAATQTMRLHVLEPPDPELTASGVNSAPEETTGGVVWQTQQAVVLSNMSEHERWPEQMKRAQALGVQSVCELPLTTARRQLGTLCFACKQMGVYGEADVHFLQLVASQVAVAVENALAFQEIEALKDKLAKEKAYLEEEARTENDFGNIVGQNAALRAILKKVETVAPTDSTVLVRGETGTGKELIARAVHDLSPRKDRTFVKLNCAAIPTGLLESELFGHEKGAFTGAITHKLGRFELAHQGTLFSTKSGTFRWSCSRSCSACFRSRNSSDWGAREPSTSTFVSSPLRITIWPRWSPRVASEVTCIIGSMFSPSPCRPCASAGMTFRGWCAISPSGSRAAWAGRSKPFRQRS